MSEPSTPPPPPSKVDGVVRWVPWVLFALVLMFSVAGIRWGLPNELHHQSYHPDEEVIWRVSRQIEPTQFDFTPGFYNYGTLYLSLLRVAGDMSSVYLGVDEQNPWRTIGNMHFAGRVISALSLAGLAVVVYGMIKPRSGPLGAAIGAALVGFSPGLLVHSRFQTTDLLATFLLALGLFFCLKIHDAESPPPLADWALAGLLIGLSAGTKYTGLLGVLSLLTAVALSQRWDLRGLMAASAAVAAGFLIGTPGVVLETAAFVRDFQYEMWHTSSGHGLIFEGVNGFALHVANLLQSIGSLGLVAGFCGILGALLTKQRWIWVLLAFALPYFLLIGRAEVLFLRYVFPLLIVFGVGLGWLAAESHIRGGFYRIGVVASIFAVGQAAAVSAVFTGFMAGTDPRDQAVQFLRQESKPDATVGLVSDPWYWSPPFFPDSTISRMPAGGLPGAIYGLQKMNEATVPPRPVRFVPVNPNDRFDWDVRLLTELKPTYVVFSSFEVGPVARLSARTDLEGIPKLIVDRFQQFHAELERGYEPISTVPKEGPLYQRYSAAYALTEDLMYVRPDLWIWKRKATP